MSDDAEKRVTIVENWAASMEGWDRAPLSLAHEIRQFLLNIADQGTGVDSGGSDGCADLWVKIQGVEYYITIQKSKAQKIADESIPAKGPEGK